MSTTVTKNLGVITAYGMAKQGGFTGTKSDFYNLLSKIDNFSTVSVMPVASSSCPKNVLYLGETGGGYVNKHLYSLQNESSIYSWNDEGSLGGGGSSLQIVELTGTSIPSAGKIYTHTVADGETFTFFTPAEGEENLFELDITQPATAVSYTLPAVTWKFGIPVLSTASSTVQLRFRYVNGTWEGWAVPLMSEYAKLSANNTFTGYQEISGQLGVTDRGQAYIGSMPQHFKTHFYSVTGLLSLGTEGTGIPCNCAGFLICGQGLNTGSYNGYYASGTSILGRYNATNLACIRITGYGTSNSDRKNIEELDRSGNLMIAGSLTQAGQTITNVTATSGTVTITPQHDKVYKYTAVASDVLTIDTSALTTDYIVTFELLITQTTPASAITLPSNVTWIGTAPTCSGDGKTYDLHIEWNGTQLVGYQKYEI